MAAKQAAALTQKEADAKTQQAIHTESKGKAFNYQAFYQTELEKKHQDKYVNVAL